MKNMQSLSFFLNQVDNFLSQKGEKPKIIVIYGPTACGKTGLSVEIAKHISSEIISTDSRQIYKYLDIGTGKVTQEETQGIVHHMIDILPPDQNFSVAEFQESSQEIINNLHKKGQIPILAGGTGLYIDSIVYDFSIPEVPADENIRKKYEDMAKEFGNMKVYEELQKIDEEYAGELHPNNLNYVIRALEVKLITGKSKRDFRIEKTLKYDTLFLTPYDENREALYEKINARVAEMFEKGLVKEVEDMLKMGYKNDDIGLKTIGYKEVIDYKEGRISLKDAIEKVQQMNRNYAKRQMTWFSRYEKK